MKCKNCGHENNEKSVYCVKCGKSINETKSKLNRKLILGIILIIAIITISALIVTANQPGSILYAPTSTISGDSYKVVEISNSTFVVPEEGYYKTKDNYHFNYSNFTCAIKKVEHYESSNDKRTIEPTTFSKTYPGSESYIIDYGYEVWNGIKIKKDDQWFHISMKTHNNKNALEFFDWMYEKNTWEGHN